MEYQQIIPVLAALGTIGGVYLTFLKIKKEVTVEFDQRVKGAVDAAISAGEHEAARLRAEIEVLDVKINNLEANVQKDVDHIKATYNNEIKNLADRIDSLRDEVRGQHSQLVALLSKMLTER